MRKKSALLTDAEFRLMEVLWAKGAATVGEVKDGLAQESPPAYSTVLTTLRIMERKGFVEHTKEGRAFIYRPLVDRQNACRSAVRHLVGRFFDDSPELLVLNILEHEQVEAEELKRLKALIEASE
ncbi:MAG: BlaI/MecI/CopY family transcriptional regulator [Pyrinomonadaceae bacterium]